MLKILILNGQGNANLGLNSKQPMKGVSIHYDYHFKTLFTKSKITFVRTFKDELAVISNT